MSTKEKVLALLTVGEFTSGQSIADALNISRSAVSQSISSLIVAGVEIHSVRGRGYRLISSLSILSTQLIQSELRKIMYQRVPKFILLDKIDSTNEYFKRISTDSYSPYFCIAEHQTHGKGRQGKQWLNRPYESILMSYRFELVGGVSSSSGLSLAIGVGVQKTLAVNGFSNVGLKWPNDIMLGSLKLGGILIELFGEIGGGCTCIVGLGLNVNSSSIIQEKIDRSVAGLQDLSVTVVNRNALVALLMHSLVSTIQEFEKSGFIAFRDDWHKAHVNQNCPVKVVSGFGVINGVAKGVDGAGSLLVRNEQGHIQKVTTGEVLA